jgi:hypothetical protein
LTPEIRPLRRAYGIEDAWLVEMEDIRMLSKSLVKNEVRLLYA